MPELWLPLQIFGGCCISHKLSVVDGPQRHPVQARTCQTSASPTRVKVSQSATSAPFPAPSLLIPLGLTILQASTISSPLSHKNSGPSVERRGTRAHYARVPGALLFAGVGYGGRVGD